MRIALLLPLISALAVPAAAGRQPGPSEQVLAAVARAEPKVQGLAGKLAACRAAGSDVAYPDAALAVAELFCRYSRADAAHPDLCAAARRSMNYVDSMLDRELRTADEVLAGRARYPAIPRWSPLGVTWHDGAFWSRREPIFLSGLNWDAAEAARHPEMVKRLGITLTDGMFRGWPRPNGSFDDKGWRGGDGRFLTDMTRAGLPVDCLYGIGVPEWIVASTPGMAQLGFGNGCDVDLEHPAAVRYREQAIDHIGPLYGAEPSFFAIDLANEPAFQGPSALTTGNWHAWLLRKYGSLAGVNKAWGTALVSLDGVRAGPSVPERVTGPWERAPVDFTRPGARGMHYDWCAYNNERISAYFQSVAARVRARAPRAATHVKAMMGLYFTGSTEARGWRMDVSYHTFGVDPEALARSCSLLGGDLDLTDLSRVPAPNRRFGSVPYVCGWLDAGLAADLLKSLAPDKPFYNSEFHVVEDNSEPDDPTSAGEHMRLAMWLAHLHGMAANLLWYWGRDADGNVMGSEWFRGSVMQQPWVLQAYAQESLSLRRFVRPVMAFARGPRPVRLLYSEASAIQDVHYLDALRDSYEALNFLGVPVGMVTERQLAAQGVPPGTRLVIAPNAGYVEDGTVAVLRAAARRGVVIGLVGERCLSATPIGAQRAEARVPGARRLALGSPQSYRPQFDAWLRAAGIRRELTAAGADEAARPAALPAWGIEVRTARQGGRRLAYLANLMRRPVTCTLRWSAPDAHLRDLRTGAAIGRRVTLRPRQVVFGAF